MGDPTRRIRRTAQGGVELQMPRFDIEVTAGPDAGKRASSLAGALTIGCAENAGLILSDPTVSRFHLELEATEEGIAIRDLGSTNGTLLGSSSIREIVVRQGVELALGQSRVRLEVMSEAENVALSEASAFGALFGRSAPMRAAFTALERAAPTTAPVLISGESGTGKELAARAIHAASPRREQPFEVVDCGGLPPTLIESELFGHERGSFTGATGERDGAFERADGGTLFLDELGELPLELQPKLLRALGEREIRRIGASSIRKVDVRVVAATNRDLRREVNAGRFRADLFYRLAVIQVRMPALRDRLDDLPLVAKHLLESIGQERGVDTSEVELDAELWQHTWPGNVRELRNYLEQVVILRIKPPLLSSEDPGASEVTAGLEQLPLTEAKNQLVARFEQSYLTKLLERTKGNVAEAARLSGVNRATLFRMIRRYGLREDG